MQGLKSWAWLPKFCRTFGILCEGSSAGSLLCKRFLRTPLQNPKVQQNSVEESPGPSFQDLLFPPG